MEALDMIIKELGWEKEVEEDHIETMSPAEIMTLVLGTRQMRLLDFS